MSFLLFSRCFPPNIFEYSQLIRHLDCLQVKVQTRNISFGLFNNPCKQNFSAISSESGCTCCPRCCHRRQTHTEQTHRKVSCSCGRTRVQSKWRQTPFVCPSSTICFENCLPFDSSDHTHMQSLGLEIIQVDTQFDTRQSHTPSGLKHVSVLHSGRNCFQKSGVHHSGEPASTEARVVATNLAGS